MSFFTLLIGGPCLVVLGLLFIIDRRRSKRTGVVLMVIGAGMFLVAVGA